MSKIGMMYLLRKIPRREYKKLMFLAVLVSLLSAWPACLRAQGLQKGDQLVSVFVGAGGAFFGAKPAPPAFRIDDRN